MMITDRYTTEQLMGYYPKGPSEALKVREIASQKYAEILSNEDILQDKSKFFNFMQQMTKELLGKAEIKSINSSLTEIGPPQNSISLISEDLKIASNVSLSKLRKLRENLDTFPSFSNFHSIQRERTSEPPLQPPVLKAGRIQSKSSSEQRVRPTQELESLSSPFSRQPEKPVSCSSSFNFQGEDEKKEEGTSEPLSRVLDGREAEEIRTPPTVISRQGELANSAGGLDTLSEEEMASASDTDEDEENEESSEEGSNKEPDTSKEDLLKRDSLRFLSDLPETIARPNPLSAGKEDNLTTDPPPPLVYPNYSSMDWEKPLLSEERKFKVISETTPSQPHRYQEKSPYLSRNESLSTEAEARRIPAIHIHNYNHFSEPPPSSSIPANRQAMLNDNLEKEVQIRRRQYPTQLKYALTDYNTLSESVDLSGLSLKRIRELTGLE